MAGDRPASADQYTHGYQASSRQMALRTADSHASFLMPFLKAGMRLLDCGCGPGTITIGLARTVAPGEAVGVDIAPSELAQARTNAEIQGISNARFEAGSAYALPFPDETFEAVFSHAMLEHVGDPPRAILEMRRVLKPGGLIGLRGSILRGHVWHPDDPAIQAAFDVWLKVWRHNGGNPDIGLEQHSMLTKAGFELISRSASYDSDFHEGMAWSIGPLITQAGFVKIAEEQGWSDRRTLTRLQEGLVKWSRQPSAAWYLAWAETVGRKL